MFHFQTDLSRRQEIIRLFILIGYCSSCWFFENQDLPSYHTGKIRIMARKQRVICGWFFSSEQIVGVEGEYWKFGGFKRHPSWYKKEGGLWSGLNSAPVCVWEWSLQHAAVMTWTGLLLPAECPEKGWHVPSGAGSEGALVSSTKYCKMAISAREKEKQIVTWDPILLYHDWVHWKGDPNT